MCSLSLTDSFGKIIKFLFQFLCRSDDVLDRGSRAQSIKSTAEIKACRSGSARDRNPVYPNSHILTRSNNHGKSILSLKLEHEPQLWREWRGDWGGARGF